MTSAFGGQSCPPARPAAVERLLEHAGKVLICLLPSEALLALLLCLDLGHRQFRHRRKWQENRDGLQYGGEHDECQRHGRGSYVAGFISVLHFYQVVHVHGYRTIAIFIVLKPPARRKRGESQGGYEARRELVQKKEA